MTARFTSILFAVLLAAGGATRCRLVPLAGLFVAAVLSAACGADDGSVTVERLDEFEVTVPAGWRVAVPSAAPQDQDVYPVLTAGPEGASPPEGGLGVFRNAEAPLEAVEATWRARLEDADLGPSTTRQKEGGIVLEFEGSRADRASGETRHVLVGVIGTEGPSQPSWVVYCDARARAFLKNCREFIDEFVPRQGAEK